MLPFPENVDKIVVGTPLHRAQKLMSKEILETKNIT